jgi:nucleoside-diphosphate-sugar epimerase
MATNEIRIMSDGSPWRPLIHCRDIARAFIAFMNAPRNAIHNRAINVGANEENYQVHDVANQVQVLMPGTIIEYTGEVGDDSRSYRVRFDMLNRLLPDFKLQYTLASGMEELHRKMVEHGFSRADFEGPQFIRLKMLKKRLDRIGAAV